MTLSFPVYRTVKRGLFVLYVNFTQIEAVLEPYNHSRYTTSSLTSDFLVWGVLDLRAQVVSLPMNVQKHTFMLFLSRYSLCLIVPHTSSYFVLPYDGVSKSFRTGRLERELQTVQFSATGCNCIAIL
jgi:hypothetical protein